MGDLVLFHISLKSQNYFTNILHTDPTFWGYQHLFEVRFEISKENTSDINIPLHFQQT